MIHIWTVKGKVRGTILNEDDDPAAIEKRPAKNLPIFAQGADEERVRQALSILGS